MTRAEFLDKYHLDLQLHVYKYYKYFCYRGVLFRLMAVTAALDCTMSVKLNLCDVFFVGNCWWALVEQAEIGNLTKQYNGEWG